MAVDLIFAREYVVRKSEEGAFDAESDRRRADLQITKVEEPKVEIQGMRQFVKEYH